MLVLGRGKGEKIEIENWAMIRIAKVEGERVLLDVTAPFCRTTSAESVADLEPSGVIVKILGIGPLPGAPRFRARIGIRVPDGAKVRRAEIAPKGRTSRGKFPWNRFQPTAKYWRKVGEEIQITLA